jgi:hypothetical protein
MTKRLTTLLAMLAALVVSAVATAMCVLVAPPPAKAAFPGETAA